MPPARNGPASGKRPNNSSARRPRSPRRDSDPADRLLRAQTLIDECPGEEVAAHPKFPPPVVAWPWPARPRPRGGRLTISSAVVICSAASTGPPCVFLRKSSGHSPDACVSRLKRVEAMLHKGDRG